MAPVRFTDLYEWDKPKKVHLYLAGILWKIIS